MNTLQIRLKNCLQTILEIQPAMRRIYRANFREDFLRLQAFASLVDSMDLAEEDVAHLETMTATFIRETGFMARRIAPAGRLQ